MKLPVTTDQTTPAAESSGEDRVLTVRIVDAKGEVLLTPASCRFSLRGFILRSTEPLRFECNRHFREAPFAQAVNRWGRVITEEKCRVNGIDNYLPLYPGDSIEFPVGGITLNLEVDD